MTVKDIETVRRVYRIRRLLSSHQTATEDAVRLLGCFGGREAILAITKAEDERRSEILKCLWREI